MSDKDKETKPQNPSQKPPQVPGDRREKGEENPIVKK